MVDVVPNDSLSHVPGCDCTCNPDVEWIDPDSGLPYANGPMVSHQPFDGIKEGRLWAVVAGGEWMMIEAGQGANQSRAPLKNPR